MKKRNPIAVALLPFITFGIYGIYWEVKTKGEMVELGAEIPTAWLIIVPIVNIWWLWKYCQGVQKVTGDKLNGVLAFVLIWLLSSIGAAIIQDSFNNNVSASPAAETAEATPVDSVPTADEAVAPEAPTDQTTPPASQPPVVPIQ